MALEFGPCDLNFQDWPDERNVAAIERQKNDWEQHDDFATSEGSEGSGDKKFSTFVRYRRRSKPIVYYSGGVAIDFPSKYCISVGSYGRQEDFSDWGNLKSSSVHYVFDDTASRDALTKGLSPQPPSLMSSDGGEPSANDVVPTLVSDGAQSRSTSPDSVNTGLVSYFGGVHLRNEIGDEGLSPTPTMDARATYYA